MPYPVGYGHSGNGGSFDGTFPFVGLRIFSRNVTLYSWIKTRVYFTGLGDLNNGGEFHANS